MAQIFDPDEIFEMALQLEKNGAQFYRKAAKGAEDSHNKSLLLDLAKMEDEHEKVFETLKKEIAEEVSDYFDPDGEAVKYLCSIADTKIFFKRDIDVTSMEEIFKEAIMAEKDSTIFYLGMKDLVPGQAGKEKIEKIIKEEMAHIRILGEKLAQLNN
jgi:rubrerythrin